MSVVDITVTTCPECKKGMMQTVQVGGKDKAGGTPSELYVTERCSRCGHERKIPI